ncbi:hypothetical protein [Pedomonas mirosovicensis]|uniref:hypothetical protein n=1 Tax=Pedomonas mirosovicensis TaxID=2908641 RepID=UPI00216910DF|nr:hypothetical protein [Pedomonas mirosovicensis]MCH8685830.1 hypothetical protein [Pedomonas mirosovicensis]
MTRAPEYDEQKRTGNPHKDAEPGIPSTQASQGRMLGVQRYVLFTGIGLVIIGFAIAYFAVFA